MQDPGFPHYLQTGWQTCHDVNGAPQECANSGQDGELRPGALTPEPRFIVENDTVLDALTGLVWSCSANPGEFPLNWKEAGEFIEQCNRDGLAGHTDWRTAQPARTAQSHGLLAQGSGSARRTSVRGCLAAMVLEQHALGRQYGVRLVRAFCGRPDVLRQDRRLLSGLARTRYERPAARTAGRSRAFRPGLDRGSLSDRCGYGPRHAHGIALDQKRGPFRTAHLGGSPGQIPDSGGAGIRRRTLLAAAHHQRARKPDRRLATRTGPAPGPPLSAMSGRSIIRPPPAATKRTGSWPCTWTRARWAWATSRTPFSTSGFCTQE